jgi:hypothetical protein
VLTRCEFRAVADGECVAGSSDEPSQSGPIAFTRYQFGYVERAALPVPVSATASLSLSAAGRAEAIRKRRGACEVETLVDDRDPSSTQATALASSGDCVKTGRMSLRSTSHDAPVRQTGAPILENGRTKGPVAAEPSLVVCLAVQKKSARPTRGEGSVGIRLINGRTGLSGAATTRDGRRTQRWRV